MQWNWTFQSFGVLTGSEIQCRSTLSIPRPKLGDGPNLSWVDAHDVAKGIVNVIGRKIRDVGTGERSYDYYFFSGPESLSMSEMASIVR